MESVHVKEALSLLDRVHLFAIQHEGDGSLQHVIEGVINMVEGIAMLSKKQTSVLIFFLLLSVFYHMFMPYWSSRVKSVLILNIAYFLTFFIKKCLHILKEQRKGKKLKN